MSITNIAMSVIVEEGNRTNIYAKEPEMYYSKEYIERYGLQTHNERAEIANGRWAMLGIVAGAISYAFTGKLFFGVF